MIAPGYLLKLLAMLLGIYSSSSLASIPFDSSLLGSLQLRQGDSSSEMISSCIAECSVIGKAYDVRNKEMLYQEEYQDFEGAGEGLKEVFYRNLSGEVFAYKLVDTQNSSIAPVYWFLDFRLEQIQYVAYPQSASQNNLIAAINDLDSAGFLQKFSEIWGEQASRDNERDYLAGVTREMLQSDIKSIELNREKPIIADAGFDAFIRSYWDQLLDKSINFKFVLPSRQSTLPMKIGSLSSNKCSRTVFDAMDPSHQPSFEDGGFQCFRIQASNWLINQLLGSIYLVYDKEQRLAVFKGLSNIRDDGNKRLNTYITYEYF